MEPDKNRELTKEERFRYIRSEMVRAGVTNAQIARDEQVSEVYVYFVLSGQRQGYRIRQAIAQKVGVPVEQLWPDTPAEHQVAA